MSFSTCALARLVECCATGGAKESASPVADIIVAVERLVTQSAGRGLHAGLDEFDGLKADLFGDPTGQRVLALAGLIEIGIGAQYLDFSSDAFVSKLLSQAFRDFDKQTVRPAIETLGDAAEERLALFKRLLHRFDKGAPATAAPPEPVFAAFESYVNLTSYVWADAAFQQFLLDTHSTSLSWLQDDDWAFLVTPRHFASALSTGWVGEKRTAGPAGGVAALRYFDWLAAVIESAGTSEVADDIAHHARWSHSIERVADRLGAWAAAMAEWPATQRDEDGERAWAAYTDRVFTTLRRLQATLAVAPLTPQHYVTLSLPRTGKRVRPFDEVRDQVNALRHQGRTGGARRCAAEAAAAAYAAAATSFTTLTTPDQAVLSDQWGSLAVDVVNACTMIAALGDADTASAYVAPIHARAQRSDKLSPYYPYEAANDILLYAREPAETGAVDTPLVQSPPKVAPPARSQQVGQRTRVLGKQTER